MDIIKPYLESLFSFYVDNMPSWLQLFAVGVPSLAWAGACLFLSGWLKRYRKWQTGYTRKVFHFLIFISAAVVQSILGLQVLCVFGLAVSAMVFLAVLLGNGNMLYEALAREKDTPHRTHYIVVPYFATLIGGTLVNTYFGSVAIAGYLITGFADAIAEPIGTRFGRHSYRVPSLKSVTSIRSIEGSSAVFLACFPALVLAFILTPELQFHTGQLPFIAVLALACTLVEAASPHGWDNALLQLVPSAILAYGLGGMM